VRDDRRGLGAAVALVIALGACAGVLFTAPPGSSISLIASPPFVQSDGGVSVISAIVIEPAGTPVSDGTTVLFFTDIGHIEPQGKTRNGIARVNFTSDSRSGIAHISAISGGGAPATTPGTTAPGSTTPPVSGGGGGTGSATINVTVGNVRVKVVCCLRAEPPRITTSNSTHVFARVIDEFGNGIPNVPVFFSVVMDQGTEFFDENGPVFTNNNGEAENVLRTRRETAGNAQVRASAPGAGVMVNSEPLVIPIR
jgi:hypothetical protein